MNSTSICIVCRAFTSIASVVFFSFSLPSPAANMKVLCTSGLRIYQPTPSQCMCLCLNFSLATKLHLVLQLLAPNSIRRLYLSLQHADSKFKRLSFIFRDGATGVYIKPLYAAMITTAVSTQPTTPRLRLRLGMAIIYLGSAYDTLNTPHGSLPHF